MILYSCQKPKQDKNKQTNKKHYWPNLNLVTLWHHISRKSFQFSSFQFSFISNTVVVIKSYKICVKTSLWGIFCLTIVVFVCLFFFFLYLFVLCNKWYTSFIKYEIWGHAWTPYPTLYFALIFIITLSFNVILQSKNGVPF